MASNKDLIASANELAAELDLKITTDSLNNEQLSALVSDLKAKKKDADNDTQADDAEDAKKAARKAGKTPTAKKPPFYLAPRKSITSKRGILSGDTADEVKAEYLEGGQKALDAFIESGHILKG